MMGKRVDIVVADDPVQKAVGEYIQVVLFEARTRPARQGAARRRSVPLRAELAQPRRGRASRNGSQEYPAPSDLLDGLLGCDSFVPDSDAEPQHQRLLRPQTVQPLMEQAEALGVTRPRAARAALAPGRPPAHRSRGWLPLFNPQQSISSRARVGNYRWSPQSHLMPSLLWVE